MEVYIKTCYDSLIRLTGDFFFSRNKGTVYVSTCRQNDEMTVDVISDAESDKINRKYNIELTPETYAGYILEELNIKILDNIGKVETLVIDYLDIENSVFNNRIPDRIKEGKIRVNPPVAIDTLHYRKYLDY